MIKWNAELTRMDGDVDDFTFTTDDGYDVQDVMTVYMDLSQESLRNEGSGWFWFTDDEDGSGILFQVDDVFSISIERDEEEETLF